MSVRFTLLAAALSMTIAAAASAGLPDASKCTIGNYIALEGTSDAAGTIPDLCSDGRCGDFTVVIRDGANEAIANALVEIKFGGCSDIRISCDQMPLQTGQSYADGDTGVVGYTDVNGRFTFKVRGNATSSSLFLTGNTTSPGTAVGVPCATISANGVLLTALKVVAYDFDGIGSPSRAVNGADVAEISLEVLRAALGATKRERADLNNDNNVTAADLSIMMQMAIQRLLGTGSANTKLTQGATTYQIVIDARTLSDTTARVLGCIAPVCFDTRSVQTFQLPAGGYMIEHCDGGGCGIRPGSAFVVTSDGKVGYGTGSEPGLMGAGTTTLTVNSFSFPPRGDDVEASMATLRLVVEPKFWNMLAGYPGFGVVGGVHRISSPAVPNRYLYDPSTKVGRSALIHSGDTADLNGTPVGSAGTPVSETNFSFIPPGFEGPNGTAELHTQMVDLNLVDATGSGTVVRAGLHAPTRPISVGEIEARPDATGIYPANSFFDIFAEVDVPLLGGNPGVTTLYNIQPLVVSNQNLTCVPPPLTLYIHGHTGPVPVVFKNDDNPDSLRWHAGEQFGWICLAGHGFEFDSTTAPHLVAGRPAGTQTLAGTGRGNSTLSSDADVFLQLMAQQPEMTSNATLNVDLEDVVTFASPSGFDQPAHRDSLLAELNQVSATSPGNPCAAFAEMSKLTRHIDAWVVDATLQQQLINRSVALVAGLKAAALLQGPCTPLAVTSAPAPQRAAIEFIHPNPTNRSTTIRFGVPRQGHVSLAIYDLAGRKIRSLIDGERNAGTYWASWDGRKDEGGTVSFGVYFARLSWGGAVDKRSIVVVR